MISSKFFSILVVFFKRYSLFLSRSVVILLIIIPFYYLGQVLSLVNLADLSRADVYHRPESEKGYSLHLVTYAHGPDVFHKNRSMEAYSGINRGVDFIYLYRKEHIDAEFLKENPILHEKIGAGYWLWKPYFILKTLENIPEGDVLLYGDSGFLIRRPITEYVSSLLKDKDIVLFDYPPEEYGTASRCATGDTFAAMGCQTEECYKSPHVWAGLILLRNTPKTREFIREWLKYCLNTDLLTGKESKLPNQPNFSFAQHDEGILSALAGKYKKDIYYERINKKFYHYFSKHRRKAENEHKSLLGNSQGMALRTQTKILNDVFIRNYMRFATYLSRLKKSFFQNGKEDQFRPRIMS
ncbi:MAG: hypothetical protein ACK5O7_05450 [Holosporales bacterium]